MKKTYKDNEIIDVKPIYSLPVDIMSRTDLLDKNIVHINQNLLKVLDRHTTRVKYEEYTIVDLNNNFISLASSIADVIVKYYNISGWVNKINCLKFLLENYIEYFLLARTENNDKDYFIELVSEKLVNNFIPICIESFTHQHRYIRKYTLDDKLSKYLKQTLINFINAVDVSISLTKLVENVSNRSEVRLLLKVDIEENSMFTTNKIKILFGFITKN